MDNFCEYIIDEDGSEICFNYKNDHVDVYRDGNFLYTRDCSEDEIINAWDSIHNY